MPRTRTIKKRNRKRNRNVSRGNKYTLNRLKEKNHKRKKTRLRRGPNRNNYNNLPKRTRKYKQSAGMMSMMQAAKSKVASKATELGSKATEYRSLKNFGERQGKNFGKEGLQDGSDSTFRQVAKYYGAEPTARAAYAAADLAGVATVSAADLVLDKIIGTTLNISGEGLSKLKKNLNRSCFGKPEVQIDILKPDRSSVRRICGKTRFIDSRFPHTVNSLKTKINLANNSALVMKKESLKKIGANTVRFFSEKDSFLVVLAPVFTNLSNLRSHDIKFKTGSDKREMANIRNFFFYNILAPRIEQMSTNKQVESVRKILRNNGLTVEQIEYLVGKFKKNDEYINLDNDSKAFYKRKASAKNQLKFEKIGDKVEIKIKLDGNMTTLSEDGLYTKLDPNLLGTFKGLIKTLYNKSKKGKQFEKEKEDTESEKVSRKREELIIGIINQLIAELQKGEKNMNEESIGDILTSLIDGNKLMKYSKSKKTDKIFINRLCTNFDGLGIKEIKEKEEKKELKAEKKAAEKKELKAEIKAEIKKKLTSKLPAETAEGQAEAALEALEAAETVAEKKAAEKKAAEKKAAEKKAAEKKAAEKKELKAEKTFHLSPLISGIDVYRPTNVKALVTGGIALQKRFFAVYDATQIDLNEEAEIKAQDLYDIQKNYAAKGIYINIRNENNFVKTIDGKVRMLSYSDVDINKKEFLKFLMILGSDLNPEKQISGNTTGQSSLDPGFVSAVQGLNGDSSTYPAASVPAASETAVPAETQPAEKNPLVEGEPILGKPAETGSGSETEPSQKNNMGWKPPVFDTSQPNLPKSVVLNEGEARIKRLDEIKEIKKKEKEAAAAEAPLAAADAAEAEAEAEADTSNAAALGIKEGTVPEGIEQAKSAIEGAKP